MWYRVFGSTQRTVHPSQLTEFLQGNGLIVSPHFRADDHGWTSGELRLAQGGPIKLERFLADVDDIRDELNAFAAELETLDYSPNNHKLMELVIGTQQFITLRRPVDCPNEAVVDTILTTACSFFAVHLSGIYQIDAQGWFAADGTLLLQEY